MKPENEKDKKVYCYSCGDLIAYIVASYDDFAIDCKDCHENQDEDEDEDEDEGVKNENQ